MDKRKHFVCCFLIALLGLQHSLFAGLYAAALCAFLREYDRWAYTGKLDKKDTFLDLISDAFGIATAVVIWGIT